MKKILTSLLIASSLSACLFDNKDEEKVDPNKITTSDNCGPMIFAQGNASKAKVGKLYGSSIGGEGCKWELSTFHNSKVQASGDYVYILEMLGSQKFTQVEAKSGTVKYQVELPGQANPQSIAFLDKNTGLIGVSNNANIYKVELSTGKALDSVSLSQWTPAGVKSPRPEDMIIKDGSLYVALQRMDAKWKSANAMVIKINPTTLKIEDSIQLKTTNPFQLTVKDSKILAISKGNTDYDANMAETSRKDGGIEELDFGTHSSTIIANETDLGGKPIHAEIRNDGKAYISLYKKFGTNPVGIWDFSAKSFTALNGSTNAWGGLVFNANTQEVFLAEDNGSTTSILSFKDMTAGTSYFQDMVQPYSLTIRP